MKIVVNGQAFVKNFENPYGLLLVKKVQDSCGNLRLHINVIYRCLYVLGYISPGFCEQSAPNLRNFRWANYIPQEVLDTKVYDWAGVLKSIYTLKLLNEKLAFCLAYLTDYGRRDNPVYIELIGFATRAKKDQIKDEAKLQEGVAWLFRFANRTYSDYVIVPEVLRPAYMKARKAEQTAHMHQQLAEYFDLQVVHTVFDVRDLGGHPRLRPYEIMDAFCRDETPERFIDNPYPQLAHIPCLKKIPHYAITPAYNLVDLVGLLTKYCPELNELQFFNLICASDYGCSRNAVGKALAALSGYPSIDTADAQYEYIICRMKKDLHVLASIDPQSPRHESI